jgi:hypothetical protein
VTAVLAGCHATIDARWATTDDTVNRWEKAAPNLPIEVRGQLPSATSEQIAHAIPNAVSAQTPESTGSKHAVNDSAPRFVLEIGNDALPHSNAYCTKPSAGSANAASPTPLTLTLTLCDGTRLVASSRTPLDPDKVSVANIPRRIDHLKNLTLIGISRSPAQFVETQS